MSKQVRSSRKTVRDIARQKGATPLVCLTAYTAPVARVADEHADIILVGDSLGMVLYGMDSTIPVTLDMMIAHGAAVVRSTSRALIVVDMPFGTYQESPQQAYRNAVRILKETGAAAVKIEGGQEMADSCAFLTARGIPVLGHIGLQPQSVHSEGGYRVKGRHEAEEEKIIKDADALVQSGSFGIVLECVLPAIATAVTERVSVPTIGIGASAQCDGQILVTEDMLGMNGASVPGFVERYASFQDDMGVALGRYAQDVKNRTFPAARHCYATSPSSSGSWNDAAESKISPRKKAAS